MGGTHLSTGWGVGCRGREYYEVTLKLYSEMQTHSVYLQNVFCLHTIYFYLQKEYEPKDVFEESAKPETTGKAR